jgi:hypothetical protein
MAKLAKKWGGWFERGAWRFPTVWHKEQFMKEASKPNQ